MPTLQVQNKISDSSLFKCAICGKEILDEKERTMIKIRGKIETNLWAHFACVKKAFKHANLEARK